MISEDRLIQCLGLLGDIDVLFFSMELVSSLWNFPIARAFSLSEHFRCDLCAVASCVGLAVI